MKTQLPKGFLKIDKNIQIALAIIMFCCIVYFPLMGIPFFILGVWQVISGLYLGLVFKNKVRQYYLLVVLGWGVAMAVLGVLEIFGVLWFAMLLLVPLCIAIWYFNNTYADWKSAGKPTERLDDVLDYEMDEL